jgi:hypothetical protein
MQINQWPSINNLEKYTKPMNLLNDKPDVSKWWGMDNVETRLHLPILRRQKFGSCLVAYRRINSKRPKHTCKN